MAKEDEINPHTLCEQSGVEMSLPSALSRSSLGADFGIADLDIEVVALGLDMTFLVSLRSNQSFPLY